MQIQVLTLSVEENLPALSELKACLSDEEQRRATRFHFEADRQCFIVAHGMLRYVLASQLNLAPAHLQFGEGEHGKPFLVDHPSLYFNISHSKDKVLIAYSFDTELGVDVEYHKAMSDYLDIAKRYFTEREVEALCACYDETSRRQRFFDLWSGKEAIIKALGCGLSQSLNQWNLSFSDGSQQIHVETMRKEVWQLKQLSIHSDYSAAIAAPVDEIEVNLKSLRAADLLIS